MVLIREGDDLVNDSNYRVVLRSYNETLKSTVKIDCESYDSFKEIVDAVSPILNKENKKGE